MDLGLTGKCISHFKLKNCVLNAGCYRAIMGFVKKRQAEELLSTCAPGTFILRFSDSELGGITIAWTSSKFGFFKTNVRIFINISFISGTQEVYSIIPNTSKDFAVRSLADRIHDLDNLQILYPDTPKEVVFQKYYTPFQGMIICKAF